MFNACCEIPTLLVTAVVGDFVYFEAMLLYARLNKQFEKEVKAIVQQWCNAYKRMKNEWIDQTLQFVTTRIVPKGSFMRLNEMKRIIDAAFGAGFCFKYGSSAYAVSEYTPRSYVSMARRRCVICSRALTTTSLVHSANFCFAHVECQRRYCVSRPADDIALADGSLHNSHPIRLGWHDDQPTDVSAAMVFFNPRGFVAKTGQELMSSMSPLVRVHNEFHQSHALVSQQEPVVIWLRPLKGVVGLEDTLAGALKLDVAAVQACFTQARAWRLKLIEERDERVNVIRAARSEAARERRAELRLAMGASSIRWRTPEDVMAFHPNAWTATMLDEFLSPCRSPPMLWMVMGRIEFLDLMLGDSNLSNATVQFFMNELALFEFPEHRHDIEYSMLPSVVKQIDSLCASQCTVHGISKRPEYLRVFITTRWNTDSTSLQFPVAWHTIWTAGARLEKAGQTTVNINASQTEQELLVDFRTLIELTLSTAGCRGDAYELLGLRGAMDQLVQHPPLQP